MNLMKWRPLQREGTDVAADASPSALAANLTTHTLDDPLGAPGWPDLLSPSNFVSVPSLSIRPRPPEPLLLTKDIEALLEEDARRRPLNESDSNRSRSPFTDASLLDWSTNSPPIIGLPAPPRGPRKVVHRERASRRRVRQQNTFLRADSFSSGELFTMTASPSSLLAHAKTIADSKPTSEIPSPQPDLGRPRPDSAVLSQEARVEEQSPLNDVTDGNGQSDPPRTEHGSNNNHHTPANNVTTNTPDVPEDVSSSCGNASVFGLHEDHEFNPPQIPLQWPSASTSPVYLLPDDPGRVGNTRQLLAHAHHNSADSDFTHSSFSSHDPPSTYEPRISISSTIYPPSTCNSSLVRNAFQAEERIMAERQVHQQTTSPSTDDAVPNVHPSFSSIIDLASVPISPNADVLPLPQFVDPDENSPARDSRGESNFPVERDELSNPHISIPPRAFLQRPAPANGRVMRPSSSPNPSISPKLSSLIPYSLLTSFTHTEGNGYRPPTTNYLNAQERSDLVRKNRKLTQVFGETPSPLSGSEELPDSPVVTNCLLPMIPNKRAHSRGASSLSEAGHIYTDSQLMPYTHDDGPKSASPLSPMTFRSSYLLNEDGDEDESPSSYESPVAQTPRSPKMKAGVLSEDRPDQRMSVIEPADSFIDLTGADMRGSIHSQSTLSLPLDDDKEERRRKRERLAKLHRFLGSRIPAELVLGPHEIGTPLPDVAPSLLIDGQTLSDGETTPNLPSWLPRRRRSSLSSSLPAQWLMEERRKEHLSDKEKALRVKRANKMERMFGEQPPQNLFHMAPPSAYMRVVVDSPRDMHARSAPSSPVTRNINKSAYQKTKAARKSNRPGTAESSKGLLGSRNTASVDLEHIHVRRNDSEGVGSMMSEAYMHYRHSLISLADIVNRDDRASLAELHEYINTDEHRSRNSDYRSERSMKATLREEKRRSLPQQSSSASLASQYAAGENRPETTTFAVRRRRAAKLSQFFGVSYRDLFGDVLESLEVGVREDGGRGTLNPDEVQDLLAQLRTLKVRRDELS